MATSATTQAYYYRSRNNLFGARMRWRPGTAEYFLETNAEMLNTASATSLRLLPRMPVGSTWNASTQPALTATLSSRVLGAVGGVPDSVVTITLSNGQVIRLSRQRGLLEGPQWLGLAATGSASVPSWVAGKEPQPFAQSPYYPLALFAMQPGDELGYVWDPFYLTAFQCSNGVVLRRFLSRMQTADSLVITFQEQMRSVTYGYPGCGTPGTITRPAELKRWAFSLRNGKSPQFPALPLLTGEYIFGPLISSGGTLLMGMGIFDYATGGSATSCPTPVQLRYQRVYGNQTGIPAGGYLPGLDYLSWQQAFGVTSAATPGINGLGDLQTNDVGLRYVRRLLPGAATYTCGSPVAFAGLLATRAEQAAAIASLAPNPAAETATLTLAQPVRPGHTLRLTDALGRPVWSTPVATGQTAVAVPLAGQPAGLYLLHLNGPDGTAASWKLVHE
ncbi:T9SS type A sorting domain-containing protein [Hymenobacter rubidus]|uniref:T9SS type A sorting domain-containing protein n=1 Tax=Hymenobacter rubidus TaxID=1441626 RepID=UPI00191FE866|nr:T9SS type A sorting domain-containing protein [Hymenobacter rubidus]